LVRSWNTSIALILNFSDLQGKEYSSLLPIEALIVAVQARISSREGDVISIGAGMRLQRGLRYLYREGKMGKVIGPNPEGQSKKSTSTAAEFAAVDGHLLCRLFRTVLHARAHPHQQLIFKA